MTDRYLSPASPPTDHQRELLEILVEEYAEVMRECFDGQQRVTKLLRFGRDETQQDQDLTNGARLGLEVGDFLATVDLLVEQGVIDRNDIDAGQRRKKEKLARYMQTEPGFVRRHRTVKGFQPSGKPSSRPSGVQGGYQGPTGQGAPSNPPSGGSSGKKEDFLSPIACEGASLIVGFIEDSCEGCGGTIVRHKDLPIWQRRLCVKCFVAEPKR